VDRLPRRLAEEGYLIDGEALKYLKSMRVDEEEALSRLLAYVKSKGNKILVISKRDVEEAFRERPRKPDLKVIYTFSDYVYSTKSVEEVYRRMFIDRFLKISRMFSRPLDKPLKNIKDVVEVEGGGNAEISVIGLVRDVERVGGDRHIKMVLEDLGGEITALVFRNSEAYRVAEMVAEDEVIMVSGRLRRSRRGGMVIYVSEVTWPDIARVKWHGLRSPIVFVSDIHVGSKHFDKKRFLNFIDFINGSYGGDWERRIGRKVRYLVIVGDIVDGIGVFPHQEEELEILDIYDQYEEACRLLSMFRRDLEIIIIPGNHDLTGYAVPSKPLPKEFFRGCGNIRLFGDPTMLEVDGVRILVTHGRSLDDAVARYSRSGYTPEGVAEAMKQLLIRRILTVSYGHNTPIAPHPVDFNVVRSVPHVLVMGHVHIAAYRRYRGVDIINTGTWQEQTRYQQSMGVMPTVGTAFLAGVGERPIMIRF